MDSTFDRLAKYAKDKDDRGLMEWASDVAAGRPGPRSPFGLGAPPHVAGVDEGVPHSASETPSLWSRIEGYSVRKLAAEAAAPTDDELLRKALAAVLAHEDDPERSWYDKTAASEKADPPKARDRWYQTWRPTAKDLESRRLMPKDEVKALLAEMFAGPGGVQRDDAAGLARVDARPRTKAQIDLLSDVYGGHRPFMQFDKGEPTEVGWEG